MLLEGVCKKCLRSSHPPLLIGIQPGLLLDLFASQEASEQSSLRPDLDSVAKSCATSSSQRIEDSKTLKASAREDSTRDSDDLDKMIPEELGNVSRLHPQ